jgi:hypothetical protein
MQYEIDRVYIRHNHKVQPIPKGWEPFGTSQAMDADAVCIWIRRQKPAKRAKKKPKKEAAK